VRQKASKDRGLRAIAPTRSPIRRSPQTALRKREGLPPFPWASLMVLVFQKDSRLGREAGFPAVKLGGGKRTKIPRPASSGPGSPVGLGKNLQSEEHQQLVGVTPHKQEGGSWRQGLEKALRHKRRVRKTKSGDAKKRMRHRRLGTGRIDEKAYKEGTTIHKNRNAKKTGLSPSPGGQRKIGKRGRHIAVRRN